MRSAFSWIGQISAAAFALFIAPYYSLRTWAAVVDPDIWWHIRTGDWIAAHHALPRQAIFSQHLELSWTAYSWLFDLMVSGAEHRFGLAGIPGLLICVQVLIGLTFLLAIQRVTRSFWWSWLIALPAIYAFYVNPLRSLLFTLLFFTLEMLLIFEVERSKNDKLLFWAAPLFLLWANFHIQFIHGIFVLGLYVGARIISVALAERPVERASYTTAMAALAAAVAASCIGPNWARPYQVAFGYAVHTGQYQYNQEMLAMDFRRPEHYVELALVLAAAYVLGHSRRRDLFRPALLLVSALVSFHSLRDAWFVSIVSAFVLAEAAAPSESPAAASRPGTQVRIALTCGTAAIVALVASFGLAHRLGANNSASIAAVIDRVYPIRATDFVRASRIPGPMFNSYDWGGFLIFNLREYPVSIDPRVDAYGDALAARAINTVHGIGWQNDPDLARANLVLIERSEPLAAALEGDRQFRLAYQDHLADVFVRTGAHD